MPSKMIENPDSYFRNLIPARDSLLLKLEEEAKQEEIPIIGPLVGNLLYILTASLKPKRVLELGTATGYSTIFLARACEFSDGKIISIEKSPGLISRAKQNFKTAGLEDRIEIRSGDAKELMAFMNEPFDLIFIDIDKEYYLGTLDECHRLLKRGGLLIVDNVGFADADPFNKAIAKHNGWKTVSLYSFLPFHSPENDGLCFALRL